MKESLKIGLCQTELDWEDSQANLDRIEKMLSELEPGVDIAILPEMFNTGFTMNAQSVAQTMKGNTVNWLETQSRKLGMAICGSAVIESSGKFFNRFLWAEDGEIKSHYDKRHLFRMAKEHETFSPGRERVFIQFKGWRIMPQVCYDLRFPVWSRTNDADLQIFVANWPAARVDAWDKLLMARAIENQCYVAGVNRVGEDGNGIPYSGHSVAISPKGKPMGVEQNEDSGWIYAEISHAELLSFREKFPVHLDADHFSITI